MAKRRLADRHRLRLACRRLLARWRSKALQKLLSNPELGKPDFAFSGTSGVLCAGAVALHEKSKQQRAEIEALLRKRRELAAHFVELKTWTTQGMFIRVLSSVFGSECAGGEVITEDPSASDYRLDSTPSSPRVSPRMSGRGCLNGHRNSNGRRPSCFSQREPIIIDPAVQAWLDERIMWRKRLRPTVF